MSKAQIAYDIDFLIQQVESICPNPYAFVAKEKIDSLVVEIKSHQELSSRANYEKFSAIIGAFNISHLYASFPEESYTNYLKHVGEKFPLKCTLKNDSVLIALNEYKQKEVREGDQILKINGKDADSIFLDFRKYTGGISVWKNNKTSSNFDKFLWLNNINSPFEIQIANANQTVKTIVLDGVMKQIPKPKSPKKALSQNQYTASYSIPEKIAYYNIGDSLAYMDFDAMTFYKNFDEYDLFLNNVFVDIKRDNIKLLVVDVRGNSGGNSLAGEKLITYLINEPLDMRGGKKWKVSQEYKDNFKQMFPFYLRPILKTDKTINSYFKAQNGSYLNSASYRINPIHNKKLHYNGRAYLVTDNATFSSANILANAIEDQNMATIIGETSGESVNDHGEIVAVKLPYSNIFVWIPSAIFIRASGNEKDPNPVIPDFYIHQSKLDKMFIKELVQYLAELDH